MIRFDCPRTCPHYEAVDVCRFMPVLRSVGPTLVTSHTAKVKVSFAANLDALAGAVVALGGSVLGQGSHALYSESVSGFGFRLPGWRYPLIVTKSGALAYDNYQGAWGNVADLQRLESEVAFAQAEQSAIALGWMTQRVDGALQIHHPNGGILTVSANGALDANGFIGQGCHDAVSALNLNTFDVVAKSEASSVVAETRVGT